MVHVILRCNELLITYKYFERITIIKLGEMTKISNFLHLCLGKHGNVNRGLRSGGHPATDISIDSPVTGDPCCVSSHRDLDGQCRGETLASEVPTSCEMVASPKI